ncbi:polyadenylate-binding protein 3-like isoform X2 [Carya illinoinensis]|uniref:polyadenylate-binding protein 3-like isoform X2 n=1 Tax=Carya illinoinensis TaxID=32201 RepID=UPI001C7288FA|nr:polyadenylate-binding protein 3-like isoform X2 [Carya illinoinensis]
MSLPSPPNTTMLIPRNVGLPQWQTKMDEGINAGQKSIHFTNKSNKKVLLHESNRSPKQVLQAKIVKATSTHLKSSSSGSSMCLEEDSESRTIIVTNVHFAATKGALALYFAKCGSVVNMVILTDEATSRRKGSAYVTFVSKESVEKALELSGSQFSSRTIKLRLKMLQEG